MPPRAKRTMLEYREWLQKSPWARGNRELDHADAFSYMAENKNVEPEICKDFLCNRVLRSQEILCGGYCIHHQHRQTTLPQVDKFL